MPIFLQKLAFLCKEFVVRFAIALLRDRAAKDLAKSGWVRNDQGMWKKDKPGPQGYDTSSSLHEAQAVRMMVDAALIKLYPLKADASNLPTQGELRSPLNSF